ncbi:MAG: cellulase family glycosylhydrolase [Bacillota bacterium]
MWAVWDEKRVHAEVREMARIGFHVCRAFVYWPDFMPTGERVEPTMLQRLRQFVDWCGEEGLGVFVTLVVGHMSGENWDVPWRQGRDLYTDPDMLAAQERLAGEAARVLQGSSGLAGWVLSNEMPLYGGHASPDSVANWSRRLVAAIRQWDGVNPIGTGDGAWNLNGGENGFDLKLLEPHVSYFGPHVYATEIDAARHSWVIPAHLWRTWSIEEVIYGQGRREKPVLLEEFGASSIQASEENHAAYVRETLHDVLLAGGSGAWVWCFSDFDLSRQHPYRHHAFELSFGVTAADGRWKAAAHEYRKFRGLLESLPRPDRLRLPEPEVAILVPSYFNTNYPFSTENRPVMQRVMLEAVALSSMAGIRVAFVEEGQDISRYRMVLLPIADFLELPPVQGPLGQSDGAIEALALVGMPGCHGEAVTEGPLSSTGAPFDGGHGDQVLAGDQVPANHVRPPRVPYRLRHACLKPRPGMLDGGQRQIHIERLRCPKRKNVDACSGHGQPVGVDVTRRGLRRVNVTRFDGNRAGWVVAAVLLDGNLAGVRVRRP